MTQTFDSSTRVSYEVVLTAKDRKPAILTICPTDQTKAPRLVPTSKDSLVVFETEDDVDAEKMMNAFAHLLALLGSTKEAF